MENPSQNPSALELLERALLNAKLSIKQDHGDHKKANQLLLEAFTEVKAELGAYELPG